MLPFWGKILEVLWVLKVLCHTGRLLYLSQISSKKRIVQNTSQSYLKYRKLYKIKTIKSINLFKTKSPHSFCRQGGASPILWHESEFAHAAASHSRSAPSKPDDLQTVKTGLWLMKAVVFIRNTLGVLPVTSF